LLQDSYSRNGVLYMSEAHGTGEANLLKGMLAGAMLSTHLYGLVSDAVYGVTTKTVRRIVRG
jgi:hypothetical protein